MKLPRYFYFFEGSQQDCESQVQYLRTQGLPIEHMLQLQINRFRLVIEHDEYLGWLVGESWRFRDRGEVAAKTTNARRQAPLDFKYPQGVERRRVRLAAQAPYRQAKKDEERRRRLSSPAFKLSRKETEKVRTELRLSPIGPQKIAEPPHRRKERIVHNDRHSTYRQTKAGSSRIGKIDYSLRPESKRSHLVYEDVICASCMCLYDRGWRYAESSRGVIYLCTVCKEALHSHFYGEGKSDAMHLAVGRKRSRR